MSVVRYIKQHDKLDCYIQHAEILNSVCLPFGMIILVMLAMLTPAIMQYQMRKQYAPCAYSKTYCLETRDSLFLLFLFLSFTIYSVIML